MHFRIAILDVSQIENNNERVDENWENVQKDKKLF